MTQIGVFGGAFDPIHTGHLAVAQDVVHQLKLDRLLFVPTARPPHRKEGPFASGDGRVAMVQAAIEGNDRFQVWMGEFEREGPSFTVDTLKTLKSEFDDSDLFLIVGADQFSRFATWKQPEQIVQMSTVVVVARDGYDGDSASHGFRHRSVVVPRLEVSSSEIRKRVRKGQPIRYLVPDAVLRIITEQDWYKNG